MKQTSLQVPLTPARGTAGKPGSGLSLRVVTDTTEFAGLEKEWDRLSARCPDTDIFSTWAWLYHWWCAYGGGHQLRLYLVRDGAGRLRGVLPCYLREARAFRWVRFREARMVGTGEDLGGDYLDVLAAPRDRAMVTSLIIPRLVSAAWDALCMDHLPAESPFTRRLPRELPGRQFVRVRTPVPIIELPPTWADYLSTLSERSRSRILRQRKAFHRDAEGRHFVWDQRHDLDQAIQRLAKLERLRWDEKAGGPVFDSGKSAAFQSLLMKRLLERDQFRLHCLEADNEIVAMLFCYWWRDTVYCLRGGVDPNHRYLAPGSVLMGYAIEHAIGEGAVRFDLLKGDFRYKRALAKQTRETISLGAYRNSSKGRIVRFHRETLTAVKRAVLGRRQPS